MDFIPFAHQNAPSVASDPLSERASTDEGFLVDLDSLVGMEYVNNDVERRRQLAAARSRRERARDRHAREQKALIPS